MDEPAAQKEPDQSRPALPEDFEEPGMPPVIPDKEVESTVPPVATGYPPSLYGPIGTFAEADPDQPPLELGQNLLATNRDTFFAITPEGELVGWGNNETGELGSTVPGKVPFAERKTLLSNVVDVHASFTNCIALDADGKLYGWQDTSEKGICIAPLKWLENGFALLMENVRTADVGFGCCAAVREDGSLWVWGENMYGQMGNGAADEEYYPPEKRLDNVAFVACDSFDMFAVTNDHRLYAWGATGGPEPVLAAEGVERVEWRGNSIQVRTTEGIWMKLQAQEDAISLTPAPIVPAERFYDALLNDDGTLWLWDEEKGAAVQIASDVVDACSATTGECLYLTRDGLLHWYDRERGEVLWTYRYSDV